MCCNCGRRHSALFDYLIVAPLAILPWALLLGIFFVWLTR
jgi:hypothetical protein